VSPGGVPTDDTAEREGRTGGTVRGGPQGAGGEEKRGRGRGGRGGGDKEEYFGETCGRK